ncbi:MAG: hypothetical protein AAF762_06670 [Pseudomonadota bacterium]
MDIGLKRARDMLDRVQAALPEVAWPKLGREVALPVYMVHNSRDAEDYFFIFDFEEFVERSREGMFVRPRLLVWAGRQDFSRAEFARQVRQAFHREFDAARAALAAEKGKRRGLGWFGWDMGFDVLSSLGAALISNIVLLLAVTTGRAVLKALPLPKWTQKKSDDAKLEDHIRDVQGRVDAALADLEVKLHRELYNHAWRGQPPGPLTGMDYDAWPLPGHVAAHLDDRTSGSWW